MRCPLYQALRWAVRLLAPAILVCLTGWGCGDDDGPSQVAPENTRPVMTEEDFIAHVAALTLAVEEGLTDEEARARATELGAKDYTREGIEGFADRLRPDPERWARIATKVDERIKELQRGERSPP